MVYLKWKMLEKIAHNVGFRTSISLRNISKAFLAQRRSSYMIIFYIFFQLLGQPQ